MPKRDQGRLDEADRLYEQYGKPLEAEHWGECVAIARDGRVVLASSLLEVMQQASEAFGPGSDVFKIGERAVGKWR